MKKCLAILLLLGLCTAVHAGDVPVPNDFAYGFLLTPDGDGAIYKVTLPQDIYQQVTRNDLGDLRVFNDLGEMLPHTIQRPEALPAQSSPTQPLPFFPLYDTDTNESDGLSLRISTDANGSILNIRPREVTQESSIVSAYLIDTSTLKEPPSELQVTWTSAGESFVSTVSVQYSNDLTHWHSVVNAATLVELRYGGHKLEQHTIAMPLQKARYLRINWPAGKEGSRVTSIRAAFSPVITKPSHQQMHLSPISASANATVFEFDTKGRFPVNTLNLRLPERNSLADAVLSSRSGKDGDWRVRYRGVFYHLQVSGTRLVTPAIRVPWVRDRHWRLKIAEERSSLGKEMPVLELGWMPHELFFLARGNPPFTLAYGSVRVKKTKQPIAMLLETISNAGEGEFIRTAHMKERTVLGGEAALKALRPAFPWKQWLLWGILIAGVLLLAWMAMHLHRQMNPGTDGDE